MIIQRLAPNTFRLTYSLASLVCVLALSGCASGFGSGLPFIGAAPKDSGDGPGSMQLVDSGRSEAPRNLPKSKYGNPEVYEVFGKQYRVMQTSAGYRERGGASWYGSKFHGRKTSSGEVYNMYDMTAAHRSLPLPTFVEVTNLENGETIVVKVNDRGPFHSDRIIDLSFGAASKLGITEQGTAQVEVVAISVNSDATEQVEQIVHASDSSPGVETSELAVAEVPASYASPQRVGPAQATPGNVMIYQVGAFGQRVNAERMKADVNKAMQINAAYIENVAGLGLYRVRFGVSLDVPESAVAGQLRTVGIEKYTIVDR